MLYRYICSPYFIFVPLIVSSRFAPPIYRWRIFLLFLFCLVTILILILVLYYYFFCFGVLLIFIPDCIVSFAPPIYRWRISDRTTCLNLFAGNCVPPSIAIHRCMARIGRENWKKKTFQSLGKMGAHPRQPLNTIVLLWCEGCQRGGLSWAHTIAERRQSLSDCSQSDIGRFSGRLEATSYDL